MKSDDFYNANPLTGAANLTATMSGCSFREMKTECRLMTALMQMQSIQI